MNEPYDADLAYIHDVGYGEFANSAAPALLKILSDCGGDSRRVVDLGCGSGIWARILADSGYQVMGVDISPAMIEIAQERVPEAIFHVMSFIEFISPRCRAVTALGEVFNYLFDSENSLPVLHQVFQEIFDSLVLNGVFIFDVAEPGRCSGMTQGFREGEDWTCLVEYLRDEPCQRLSRRIVTFRKVGDTYRRHEEMHHQQLYERTVIADILQRMGFQVEILEGYGPSTFAKGVVGFVARKGRGAMH